MSSDHEAMGTTAVASDAGGGTFQERAIGEATNPLEQINATFKRTSSRIWLGVGGLALLVAALVIWGFVAQQVVTTSTQVALLPSTGLYPVPVLQTAVVHQIDAPLGSTVVAGQRLGVLSVPGSAPIDITAPIAGTVASVQATTGAIIASGSTFLYLAPKGPETVAIGLLTPAAVGTVTPGQGATVAFPTVNQVRYGRIEATVDFVAALPLTAGRAMALFDNPTTAAGVLQAGPVYEVRLDLHEAQTPTGYAWTVGKGLTNPLPINSIGMADIVTSHRSLASRAFGS